MKISCRPFKKEDFTEYQSWFSDNILNQELGPMEKDDEWLNHVLRETMGKEFSFFMGEELIAVVGILFPTQNEQAFYITDFAVKPNQQGKGVGSAVLTYLLSLHKVETVKIWKVYVNKRNKLAQKFFEKNKWDHIDTPPEKEMLQMQHTIL